MRPADVRKPPPEQPTFKSRYKLHGMIAAVVMMWLDFAYVYHGLISHDPAALSAGMIAMFAAAGTAYYFG
jgi:hypothetical protein